MIYEDADPLTVSAADESPGRSRLASRLLRAVGPHLAAISLLAGMLAVFLWPITSGQKVLSPADLIYGAYPWAADPPSDFSQPGNVYQSDDAFISYPRRHAFYTEEGGSWWEDDYLSGTRATFSVEHLGLNFYPPSWVYHVLPFDIANGIFHAGVLLLAGVGMYLLLMQLRFPWLARVYGAMLFMLNGHFLVWLGAFSLPAILGLIPLMIFGLERYKERREPIYLAIPAACLAVQLYIAYTPGWVTTAAVLCIYGAVRFLPDLWARRIRLTATTGAAFAAAAVLGAMLGAYSLVPSLTSTLDSSYQQDRALGLAHLPLEDAWTYLFPDYWGSEDNWIGVGGNYPEWVAYAAVSAAPLAFLGFWHMRRHWAGWFSAALLVFCAAQVFGIPPLKELAHLPGLKQVAASRWFFGMNLVLALMAPAGLAMLMSGEIKPRVRPWLVAGLAGLAALALLSVGILSLDSSDANWLLITEGEGLVPSADELFDGYATHLHRQLGFLFGGILLAATALLVPRRAAAAAGAIVVVGFLDLFAFGYDYNATIERDDLYPSTPGIEFLRKDDDLFRIAPVASDGGRQVFPGFTANLFRLRTITGYDHYRGEEYLTFIDPLRSVTDRAITELYGYVPVGTDRVPLNPNLLRILNVKYVVTEPAGLYEQTGGQPDNETAFQVYGEHTQGQTFTASSGDDAIELLLATGGGPGPDSEIIVHIRSSALATRDLVTETIDGRNLEDNSWHVISLPQISRDRLLYVEVEAPEATIERPLLIWGLAEARDSGERYDAGNSVEGALTHRVLRSPDWASAVYEGDDMSVFEVDGVLPPVWAARESEAADDLESAVEIIVAENFDPSSTIVLDERNARSAEASQMDVEITQYSSDTLSARADFSEDGYLVFSVLHDDGWQATVDGQDAELLKANGLLQAVALEAGVHEVKLEFLPGEYVWGQRISLVTLVATLVGGMAYVGYTQRRRLRRSVASQTSN